MSLFLYSCNKDSSTALSKNRSGRVVASGMSLSGDYVERNNPELASLINELLAVKTSESLYKYLKKVDKNYETYTKAETKYYALQMSMMIPVKGIYWRLDGLFSSHFGDSRVDFTNTAQNLYSALINRIAMFNDVFAGFSDSNHWKAGYDFLAEPSDAFTFNPVATTRDCVNAKYGSKKGRYYGGSFKTEEGFRGFLACEYYPALIVAEKRLEALLSTTEIQAMEKSAQFFAWDSRVVFGADSFRAEAGEDIDRIRKITGGDVYALMAGVESMKASTESLLAYKLKGLVGIVNQAGFAIASPGVRLLSGRRDGKWNAQKRTEIIRKHKDFLTAETSNFYGGDYKVWMKRSLASVEKWWQYADKSKQTYEATSEFFDHDDAQVALNPALIDFVGRSLNITNNNIKDMIFNNESIVQSVSNGKKVRLKFREIYTKPITDLKVYLPTSFKSKGKDERNFKSSVLKTKITYSDYLIGSSTMWNIKEYKKIFPKVKTKEDLREAARLFGQSWGGVTGLTLLNQIFL